MKRKLSVFLIAILLFSLAGCKTDAPSNSPLPDDTNGQVELGPYGTVEPVIGPKDAFNPLTGEYNLARERSGQRPYAVYIGNLHHSWPQSGIAGADILFEIEAEGGLTRVMGIFSDIRELEKIGSVRSGRDHFQEAVAYLDPVIISQGNSYPADYAIEMFGLNVLDFNDSNIHELLFWRDEERAKSYATEHTWYVDGSKSDLAMRVAAFSSESKFSGTAFPFSPEADRILPEDGAADWVKFRFSINDYSNYDGDLRYDAENRTYVKWQGGRQQIDAQSAVRYPGSAAGSDDLPLAFENVIVLFADIQPKADDWKELVNIIYQNGGEGYWFSEGQYEAFDWTKGDFKDPYVFTKKDGSPLVLNAGKTYVAVVDNDLIHTLEITP